MMKRSELKAIIKECLVEILAEGMGSGLKGQVNEAVQEARSRPTQQRPATPARRQQAPNPMKEHIQQLTQGNSILADVLAHTAAVTLPKMMQEPDPERQRQQMQDMLGAGGGGFYQNMPHDPEPPTDFYPQIAQQAPAERNNPMWDALAFGESSQARAARSMPTSKIPDQVLNRKVSG